MGFWDAFLAPPDIQPPAKCLIIDIGKAFEVDSDYAKTGESEGWLEFTGWNSDENGNLVYHYRHI